VGHLAKLGVVALAALVVGDVVLVGLALRHVRGDPAPMTDVVAAPGPTSEPSTTPTDDPSETPTPTPESTPESTPEPTRNPAADAPRMLIDIGTGQAVARAATGACGKGGAKVELSLDGGRTFRPSSVPAAAVVLRVASVDADNAWLVATGADCRAVTTFRTTNGGGTWERTEGSDGSWHRLAEAGTRIHAPAGPADIPCADGQDVTGFSTLSADEAYTLCGDGAVQRTVDGGQEWTAQGRLAGADDLDFVDATTGLAVVTGARSCAGVAVMATGDGAETWESRACVETEVDGLPDVSADGERAYLGVGDAVFYSDDSGATWEPRTAP